MANYHVTFTTGEKFNIITNGQITPHEVVTAWQNPNLPIDNILTIDDGLRILLVNKETNVVEAAGLNLTPSETQYLAASVDGQIGEIYK